MNDEDMDETIDDTVTSTKKAGHRSSKSKSSSKVPTIATETPIKKSGKNKRAPIVIVTPDTEEISTTKSDKVHENEATATYDQEVTIKPPKKKRTPKAETNNVNTEAIKKRRSKAPKPPPPPIDDEFQIIETPIIDESEPRIEVKPKDKKKLKSKVPKQAISDSFDDLEVTNLDDVYPTDADINVNSLDDPPPYQPENEVSEYEKAIIDTYSNLASKVSFSQYVGDDQWCIIHLPKSARTEPKSRLRKMLPGGSKDEKDGKPATKPSAPKGSLFSRIRTSVQTLVSDENNLLFGERSNYDAAYYDDEPDGIDTDDLHRYAHRLRQLEDNDRELNPEFLVLRDGKTVYGVHEADTEGKVTLATRKPIYDRFADQQPDEQAEKKKLFSRLKIPFSRNKDKGEKDSKSANATPDPKIRRKSSRQSLNDDMTTMATHNP